MQQQEHVLSCDWGTSSFRLRLIDTSSQKCLAKVESDQGNAVLFNQWKNKTGADRLTFYLLYLKQSISELKAPDGISIDSLPVLISGMASSSVGMKELPYADLPFMLDGSSANAEWISAAPTLNNRVLLISGVQQADDVMRGEETQLAGIATLVDLQESVPMIYILPGTHSKHISVTHNRISQFRTFMTGEIFEYFVSTVF